MKYRGGGSNLHGALKLTRTNIFNANRRDRAHVQNVIVLVTDGEPTTYTANNGKAVYDIESPGFAKARRMALDEANLLKNRNVRIVGIGVGADVSVRFQ